MDQQRIDAFNEEQKRLAEERAAKLAQTQQTETLSDSVKSGAKMTTAAILSSNKKNNEEIQQVVDSINRMNVTTFLASKDNWATVVEDMAQAAERIQGVVDGLNKGGVKQIEKSFTDAVKGLQDVVSQVKSVKVQSDDDVKSELERIRDALGTLQLDPVINVASPEVTVQSSPVDLKPLQKTLDDHFRDQQSQSGKIDLSSFRAQDLMGDDSFQYVGFVAPDGKWYIIENDIDGGSLRYKFGKSAYKTSWKAHMNLAYKLLNEAIREVQA